MGKFLMLCSAAKKKKKKCKWVGANVVASVAVGVVVGERRVKPRP